MMREASYARKALWNVPPECLIHLFIELSDVFDMTICGYSSKTEYEITIIASIPYCYINENHASAVSVFRWGLDILLVNQNILSGYPFTETRTMTFFSNYYWPYHIGIF